MIIASIYVTPPNLYQVSQEVDNLLYKQTVPVDLVVLNVCDKYHNFVSSTVSIAMKSLSDNIIVNECSDSGFATPILGLISSELELEEDDIILFLDQSCLDSYPEQMVEEYIDSFSILKDCYDTALGVYGFNVEDIVFSESKVLESRAVSRTESRHFRGVDGFRQWAGFAIKAKNIDKLSDVSVIHHLDDAMFFNSDVFISNCLNRHFSLREICTERLSISNVPQPCVLTTKSNIDLACLAMLIRKGLNELPSSSELLNKQAVAEDFSNKSFIDLKIEDDLDSMTLFEVIHESDDKLKKQKLLSTIFNSAGMNATAVDGSKEMLKFFSRFGLEQTIDKFLERAAFKPRSLRKNKAACIFHLPLDGSHGCHQRAIETINALGEVGCEVHLLSRQDEWNKWEDKHVEKAKSLGVEHLDIFNPEGTFENIVEEWSEYIISKVSSEGYDLVVVHYEDVLTDKAYRFLSERSSTVDSQDDISLGSTLKEYTSIEDDLLKLRALHSFKRGEPRNSKRDIITSYITELEYSNLGASKDCYIPNLSKSNITEKSFSKNPVFLGSDNPFNVQAVKLLDKHIKNPVDIIGNVVNHVETTNGNLNMVGFVEDIAEVFEKCAFSICPIVLGTGSKIKIQDSLANATPVVSMIDSGLYSDIIHGINGFLCYTLEELAMYSNMLYNDREMCKQMGKSAKIISDNGVDRRITFQELYAILTRASDFRHV